MKGESFYFGDIENREEESLIILKTSSNGYNRGLNEIERSDSFELEELEKQEQEDLILNGTKKSDSMTSAVNLLKTILGSGLLAIPCAFSNFGYLIGFLMLMICYVCGVFSINLLVDCDDKIKKAGKLGGSYRQLAQISNGKNQSLIDLAVFLKCLGSSISYFVLIGDIMPDVGKELFKLDKSRKFWILFFGIVIMIPLSFIKNIKSLKYTSVVGLIAVIYLILVSIFTFENKKIIELNPKIDTFKFSNLKSFPVFIFSFICHQNIFTIKNESKHPSSLSFSLLVWFCMTICFVLYLIFGFVSFATFGSKTSGNIFLNCT
jgi:amino acid permease